METAGDISVFSHTSRISSHLVEASSLFFQMIPVFLCSERMGKVAPSVFSSVRTGSETALGTPADAKAPGGSVFNK